jgi:transglutaminase-like putative cysteine protease
VRIVNLAGTQIPAAPDPNAAGGPTRITFDRASSTLSTPDASFSAGDTFQMTSESPRFDPAVLAAATSLDPGDRIYLKLPDDFPDDAEALAKEVTAGAANSYDAALLLQNWFRSEFTYSLEVQQGHSNNAIEAFLRDKVGYCEQFAGTYAAMMRSLGIPARVAVGFTTGKATGTGFTVTGRNAHAWPEVWFDGLGWVLFEPTPGRGASGAQSYTGVEAAQDTSTGTQQDGVQPAPDDAATDAANTAPTTLPPIPAGEGLDVPIPPAPIATTAAASSGAGNAWIPLVLLAAIAVAVAAPPIGRRIRRRARRSPSEQLANNWDRAVDALRLVDVPIVASATPTETAIVAVRTFPIVSRPMRSLADTITVATYAEDGAVDLDHVGAYGASTVRDASHWARQIERAVNDSVPKRVRVYRYFTNWK